MRHDGLDAARDLLRNTFGHADFRGLQAGVIGEILAGRSALAVLPTGGRFGSAWPRSGCLAPDCPDGRPSVGLAAVGGGSRDRAELRLADALEFVDSFARP